MASKGKYGQMNDMPRGWRCATDINLKIYEMWKGLIRRSFDTNFKRQWPSYSQVTCHPDLMRLSNFVAWIRTEPRYQEFLNTYKSKAWTVDKDLKQPGNLIYDFPYMSLIPMSENTQEMLSRCGNPMSNNSYCQSKRVRRINPNNPLDVKEYNSLMDTEQDGFWHGGVSACCRGVQKMHKGYYWEYI